MNQTFTNYRKENFLHLIIFIWVLLFSIAAISRSVIMDNNKSKRECQFRGEFQTILLEKSFIPPITKSSYSNHIKTTQNYRHIVNHSESTSFKTTTIKKEIIKTKSSISNVPKKVLKMNLKGGDNEIN